jgi:hypothetical protein
MSPQSSECSSDNFTVEDLFAHTDISQDIPFDYTSNDPLVLTLTGSYLSPPVDWLSDTEIVRTTLGRLWTHSIRLRTYSI